MIGTYRQIELTHLCRLHQTLTFGLDAAKLPDFADTHICIANNVGGIGEALCLNISSNLHAFADSLDGFNQLIECSNTFAFTDIG